MEATRKNAVLRKFGAAVRKHRKTTKLSQEAFADLCEIDRSYLGAVERGEHNIALLNIIKICDGLEINPSELFAALDKRPIASPRINRYELGVHKADYRIAQNLSKILNVPTGYFYTEEDNLAELMLGFHRLSAKKKNEVIKFARTLGPTA